ncbi:MAG: hypothetical protein BA867_12670 [Desulfobacterales bacterium S5133MH16]|nr:MAG: hypothetical protein BA867_12670 [Desulfobacterales bacterium S5133MH16]
MLQNHTLEHRKHKRQELPKAIALSPGNACVLINISRSGLLFKSLSPVAWPAKWSLDIITVKREFDIEDCPVELVWTKKDDKLIGSSTRMQTVGVKFGDLNLSQGTKLYYLLSNFNYTFSVNLFRESLLI